MSNATNYNLLSALWETRRVTIGWHDEDELRVLSDARALTCPVCRRPVVLHAGRVRAHHFAHLPGSVCSLPLTEPETEEHRAGKLLLARWLRECLPNAEVIVEAFLSETNQRADVLAVVPGKRLRRFVFEFQCANLSAKEWRRRHRLYRESGMEDIWLLGGSRLQVAPLTPNPLSHGNPLRGGRGGNSVSHLPSPQRGTSDRGRGAGGEGQMLRTTDLERALFWDGAPLLFLASLDGYLSTEALARFRPDIESQAAKLTGRLTVKPLPELAFPESLFDWPHAAHPDAPNFTPPNRSAANAPNSNAKGFNDRWLWEWLVNRHRVTRETLAAFFGLPVKHSEAFACEAAAWQAAIYYRFVHRRVGDAWWLADVERWSRAYLPLARPVELKVLQGALAEYQEILAAAGFLSLPMGYGRLHARITADLNTLPALPDVEETLRLARYRRTLTREAVAEYNASSK